jgi:hypothetical protein
MYISLNEVISVGGSTHLNYAFECMYRLYFVLNFGSLLSHVLVQLSTVLAHGSDSLCHIPALYCVKIA